MFDIGFSELVAIGIVALVVIGPERLPKVARTAGHLIGRLQRYVSDVKADISREMQLDELKKLQSEMQESARSIERSISSEVQAAEQSLDEAIEPVRSIGKNGASGTPAEEPAAGTSTVTPAVSDEHADPTAASAPRSANTA